MNETDKKYISIIFSLIIIVNTGLAYKIHRNKEEIKKARKSCDFQIDQINNVLDEMREGE